jgi:hypothetical protein
VTNLFAVIAGPGLPPQLRGGDPVTRQSIFFPKTLFAKKMDARVKPAHDG